MLQRALVCLLSLSCNADEQAIPRETARAWLAEAQALCSADDGELWGRSLCGPLMFVDPASREIIANRADARQWLRAEGDLFVGVMPADMIFANTAIEWAGVRWTQFVWPLPDDAGRRATLLMHESFHRVQPELALPMANEAGNAHLDSLDGRYLMRLEWRALAEALAARSRSKARAALNDALSFRARRQQIFPKAAREESGLELNEGLAEYTGIRLGLQTPEARIAAATNGLQKRAEDPTFVRSFAYATGPAYGLLLDRWSPGWRKQLADSTPPDVLLGRAMKVSTPTGDAALQAAAARYDGPALRTAEEQRDATRRARLEAYRQRFITGPVLVAPLVNKSLQFDPRNLQPLDDSGTVYTKLRVTDDWGVLEVTDGALLKPDWSAVVLSAPVNRDPEGAQGQGWTLKLNRGWQILRGERADDWKLAPAP